MMGSENNNMSLMEGCCAAVIMVPGVLIVLWVFLKLFADKGNVINGKMAKEIHEEREPGVLNELRRRGLIR